MLIGMFLLEDIGTNLTGLTHRNFAVAKDLIDKKGEDYFQRALGRLDKALKTLHADAEISLQKLSATFRRADLVEALRDGAPILVELPQLNQAPSKFD